jgi:hypothetical protein
LLQHIPQTNIPARGLLKLVDGFTGDFTLFRIISLAFSKISSVIRAGCLPSETIHLSSGTFLFAPFFFRSTIIYSFDPRYFSSIDWVFN